MIDYQLAIVNGIPMLIRLDVNSEIVKGLERR